MSTILHYVKKHILSLIIIIIVLFVMSQLDLSLPEYMSRIINYGINNYGIEEKIPEVVANDHYLVLDYLEPDLVDKYYKKEDDVNKISQYPIIESESFVYVLNQSVSEEDKKEIEKAILILGLVSMDNGSYSHNQLTIFNSLDSSVKDTMIMTLEDAILTLNEMEKQGIEQNIIKEIYKYVEIDLTNKQFTYLYKTGGIMLLISFFAIIMSFTQHFFSARLGAGVGYQIREDIFKKVSSLSSSDFEKFSTASLITRSTNDANQIQMMLSTSMRMMIYSPILGISGVFKIFSYNKDLTWILGVSLGALVFIIIAIFALGIPKFVKMQKLLDRLNLVIRELFTGQLVIRAFSTEKFHDNRFDEANNNLSRNNRFVQRLMSVFQPVTNLIFSCTTLAIFWFGAQAINAGSFQIGDLIAYIQYTTQILMAFLMMSMLVIMIPQALISAKRIQEVLDIEPSIKDIENPLKIEDNEVTLSFNNVTFKYQDTEKPVISDINFDLKQQETLAIIGSTGSGKSTLINLIPRFYDSSSGVVALGGVDVKQLDKEEIHRHVGFIFQKAFLFTGTIRSNLLYANQEATEEDMLEALRIAQIKDYVLSLEKGLDTEVEKGGSNFSGGQKQRLCIARTILRKAKIYIFDDTFSALDFKTERALREELNILIKETKSTAIIVAQRISTIMNADKILVLDKGNMVGLGTHKELLNSCQVYQEIANSQLNQTELENGR